MVGLIWLAAAMVSSVSGSFEIAVFHAVLGCVFLYSAYTTRKKEKEKKGDR